MNLSKKHIVCLMLLVLTAACADQSQFNAMSSAGAGGEAPLANDGSQLPQVDQEPKVPAETEPKAPTETAPSPENTPTSNAKEGSTIAPVIVHPDQVDEVPESLIVKKENPSFPLPELGTPDKPVSPVVKPKKSTGMPYRLAWESGTQIIWSYRTRPWSDFVFKLIKNDVANQLLGGAEDIEKFCPKYQSLNNDLRINFWGALVSAITKYESSFEPTTSVTEKTMGIDPVTRSQVRSEGLMQLSYQDKTGWSFCDFDWEADKNLAVRDPKKTILDPYKNLNCGIRILAQQVHTKRRITLESDVYWAVLKVGGKYEKIDEIAAMTRRMIPPCN